MLITEIYLLCCACRNIALMKQKLYICVRMVQVYVFAKIRSHCVTCFLLGGILHSGSISQIIKFVITNDPG